ncbi:MAG: SAM-dependent methyltransferase, partial [Bacteroidales bacterium]|nr:SAM-dependent methyltransferase [Bacteroidales bacterium]
MNHNILRTEVQDFINSHLKSDLSKLIFKGSPFEDVSIQELAAQIESKRKCENKLPLWFHTKNIYFPPKLSFEQSSSELTADYKSKIIKGENLIDITGGMGVDALYFAKSFKSIVHCELNTELSELTQHNFQQLNASNIQCIAGDGIETLKNHTYKFDWIYTDPARRDSNKNKVFLLSECSPNIPELIDTLFEFSNKILLKAAPLLDITNGIRELGHTKEVHIVSVNNECKELLFILEKGYQGPVQYKTINLLDEYAQEFEFNEEEQQEVAPLSLPENYLYEPNSSIMKSGGFNSLSATFGIGKLHPNSHLYTSKKRIEAFPGRAFKIENILNYDKKNLMKRLPEGKANITVRNFRSDVDQIRKKTKIKDGGDIYLFFTTNR